MFPTAANAALLVTDQKPLIGARDGQTVTATFTVNDPANNFTYFGEPDGSGSLSATARLYFDSASIVSSNQPGTDFWWSDAAFTNLGDGTFTLTALIDPTLAQWSAYDGEPSGTKAEPFTAAASHIADIGLSFRGGYFFANGVGASDGLGTFTLTGFTVN